MKVLLVNDWNVNVGIIETDMIPKVGEIVDEYKIIASMPIHKFLNETFISPDAHELYLSHDWIVVGKK